MGDILRRGNQQVSSCNTRPNPWMLNSQDLDPCRQVEQLCTSGPPVKLGDVTDNLSCPSVNSPETCCCSVVTYALLSACWVCQGHDPVDIDSSITPSYIDFFNNSGCLALNSSDTQLQAKGSPIPSWAWNYPSSLSNHWNFSEARIDGLAIAQQPSGSQPIITPANPSVMLPSPTAPASSSLPASSKLSPSPGTIAAAVLGSLALISLISIGSWFVWRWRRRRRVNQHNKGVKVDLTEPEMAGPTCATDLVSGAPNLLRRAGIFPFPYEDVVPHYHKDAPHSLEPSSTDTRTQSDSNRDNHPSRRHTTPVASASLPMDQLDRDLARLQGFDVSSTSQVIEPYRGGGKGQVHHPYTHKTQRKRAASVTTFTPSSNSGSAKSRRARRKSGGEDAAKGRYFHLPPSAQYLADVARYPENVDPERPWEIRRDGGTSLK